MLYLPDCHCAKPQCKQLDGGQMYLMHCFKGISQLWGMLTEQSGWSPGSLQSERIWRRFPKGCPLALWSVTSCYLVEFLEPPPEVLLARNQAFWYMFLGFVLFFSFLRKGTSYANHKKCLCSLVFITSEGWWNEQRTIMIPTLWVLWKFIPTSLLCTCLVVTKFQ